MIAISIGEKEELVVSSDLIFFEGANCRRSLLVSEWFESSVLFVSSRLHA